MLTLAAVEHELRDAGLTPRGAFHPEPEDGAPDIQPGRPAATVVLAGNAGPGMWRAFSAERDPDRDTLDDWSRAKLEPLAARLGARALYPFEAPYLPFQRWASRAGPCHVSPLGMFIHPDFGLWHGFRGALAFAERLDLPAADRRALPCETCTGKPCLTTCPVAAFSRAGYDVPACAAHLATPQGADCMAEGCRARRACPVGRDAIYEPAQAAFHMKAFLRARRDEG